MARTPTLPRVAVLGAGPIGLEAALVAQSLGLDVTLFEAGDQPAPAVGRWGFVRMFTPFGMNVTPLGRDTLRREHPKVQFPADADLLTGQQFREAYLGPLAQSPALQGVMRLGSRVLAVGRTGWRRGEPIDPRKPPPFRLLVKTTSNEEQFHSADAVLDCSGTYQRPNWLGDGNLPARGEMAARPHIHYWLEDILGQRRDHFAERTTLVVGGGYGAAWAVCDLAALAEERQSTWVIWLTRTARPSPLPRLPGDPLKERDRIAARANSLATRADGNLEHHPQSQVEEIAPQPDGTFVVSARVAGKPMAWPVERLIAHVGYRADRALTEELGVGEIASGSEATAEPNYFVLGAKGHGRGPGFLLTDGHAQIRRAFAALARQWPAIPAAPKAA